MRRRRYCISCAQVVLLTIPLPVLAGPAPRPGGQTGLAEQVVPSTGHSSRITFGNALVKLSRAGVIDRRKLEALYTGAGGAATDLRLILDQPWPAPIRITARNAQLYVNLLWPLGLANRMTSNRSSPLNGPERSTFASTGGWTLGRAPDGAIYFNAWPIVPLDAQQEALVTRVAQHTFRPCCNNSTFFQDCNHGSALLGLLALGASQGLTEDELYREALAFNAFWFPAQYTQMALYFKLVKGTEWRSVDPRTALAAAYSSAAGLRETVLRPLQDRGLVPAPGADRCST
ncbi:MAG TPA: hypothetical protein VKD22_03880 [Ramlibacter sp.]|nr:hypothetical protein [Ramlibacter sp.]